MPDETGVADDPAVAELQFSRTAGKSVGVHAVVRANYGNKITVLLFPVD
jgi:hypothetical protein